MRNEEEVRKKQARRKKRAKEKKEKAGNEAPQDADDDEIKLVDLFTPHVVIRGNGKIRSFAFAAESTSTKGGIQVKYTIHMFKRTTTYVVQVLLALASNALEVYTIPPPTKSKDSPLEASKSFSVDLPGHRTDIRSLCLSSDDQLLASASNGMSVFRQKPTRLIVYRFIKNLEHENDIMHTDDGMRPCDM